MSLSETDLNLPREVLLVGPDPFIDIDEGRALAQAIVDTIREPLLVLDRNLHVVLASRSFYLTFNMGRQDVHGRPVYALGDGQWNIPELRSLLEEIVPQHAVIEGYEVEQDFSGIGRRTMLLNARKVFPREDSTCHRGHHRSARRGARAERPAAAEGSTAAGNAAPYRK